MKAGHGAGCGSHTIAICALLGACSGHDKPPSTVVDACRMQSERPQWFAAMRRTEQQAGACRCRCSSPPSPANRASARRPADQAHRQRLLLARRAALQRLWLCAGDRRHLGRLPARHRPAPGRPQRLRRLLGLHRLVHELQQPGERRAAAATPTTSTSPTTRARPASPAAATATRPGCRRWRATSRPGRRSTSSSCRAARSVR